jgi:hypothetical protein
MSSVTTSKNLSLLNPTGSKARLKGASITIMVVFLALMGLTAGCSGADAADDGSTTNDDNELRCISANATKLATIAKKVDGKKSGGYCYRYVKAHLRGAGFSTASLESKGYGVSAYKFTTWAKANPEDLGRMGMKKVSLGLNELPKGAVIVWPRGMCGYHKVHGHIEVVVDDNSSRACSDFCGRIKKNCGTPDIFIPKSCTTTQTTEGDGTAPEDDSDKAPAVDPDSDSADPDAKPPADDADDGDKADGDDDKAPATAGSCWSPTLNDQVDAYECVQSRKDKVWFQCKDGSWYRGVTGNTGPFTECKEKHALK